jgi:hypothetical protein
VEPTVAGGTPNDALLRTSPSPPAGAAVPSGEATGPAVEEVVATGGAAVTELNFLASSELLLLDFF